MAKKKIKIKPQKCVVCGKPFQKEEYDNRDVIAVVVGISPRGQVVRKPAHKSCAAKKGLSTKYKKEPMNIPRKKMHKKGTLDDWMR